MPDDILNRIDDTLDDWTGSADSARWAGGPDESEWPEPREPQGFPRLSWTLVAEPQHCERCAATRETP